MSEPRYYVMWRATSHVTGKRTRHLSAPFADLRAAKFYKQGVSPSRNPIILVEVPND
jgi:hypothetical protein